LTTKRERELGRNYAKERIRAKELKVEKATSPEILELQKQKDALDAKIKHLQKKQCETLSREEEITIRTLAKTYKPKEIAKLLKKRIEQVNKALGKYSDIQKTQPKSKDYRLPKIFREQTGRDIDWDNKDDMVIYRVIRKEFLKSQKPKKKITKATKHIRKKRALETDQQRAQRIRDLHQECVKCHEYKCRCKTFTHHLTHWKEHDKMKECPYCFGEGKWTIQTTVDSGGHRLTEYDRHIRRNNIDQIDWVRQHRPNGEPIPKTDNGSGIYDEKGNDLGKIHIKQSKVVVVPTDVFIDRKTYNSLSKKEKKAYKAALNNLTEEQLEEILRRKRESKK
jgi:hypothetical protein